MARRKAEKAAASAPPPERSERSERSERPERTERTEPSSGGPPRLQLAGGNRPSWRDRESSRTASGAGPADSAAPPARTSTPMERTDSNERPSGDRSSGPPRLNLAGGAKSSWRDREAAKTAGGGPPPERNGPPPAAAARVASGRGAPLDRGDSGRGDSNNNRNGGDSSAAPPAETLPSGGAGKWVPRFRRDG